jgi:hypothetical protein
MAVRITFIEDIKQLDSVRGMSKEFKVVYLSVEILISHMSFPSLSGNIVFCC